MMAPIGAGRGEMSGFKGPEGEVEDVTLPVRGDDDSGGDVGEEPLVVVVWGSSEGEVDMIFRRGEVAGCASAGDQRRFNCR